MTPDEVSDADSSRPDTSMWVRHRGELRLLPVCAHTRPYSTAAGRRVLANWQPGDPVLPERVALGDREMVVEGSGRPRDPMWCADMEDRALPACDCGEREHRRAPASSRRRRRPEVTVMLPGD